MTKDCMTPPVHPPIKTPISTLPLASLEDSLHLFPAPYPVISRAFWTGTAPIMAELDAIVSPGEFAALPELDDDALAAIVRSLHAFEVDISQKRRKLHDVIDELQTEIGRRYQTGEISVDSLLS